MVDRIFVDEHENLHINRDNLHINRDNLHINHENLHINRDNLHINRENLYASWIRNILISSLVVLALFGFMSEKTENNWQRIFIILTGTLITFISIYAIWNSMVYTDYTIMAWGFIFVVSSILIVSLVCS
jgi:hypothetical protein